MKKLRQKLAFYRRLGKVFDKNLLKTAHYFRENDKSAIATILKK